MRWSPYIIGPSVARKNAGRPRLAHHHKGWWNGTKNGWYEGEEIVELNLWYGKTGDTPPRPRFVHHETHMEWPRRELGTPAVGGERLTACATRPPNNEIMIIMMMIIIIIININIIISVFWSKTSSSLQAKERRLQFYQNLIDAVTSHCFPHPTITLAFQQTLKDLKISQGHHVEVKIMDLANWALWTSQKFTTIIINYIYQSVLPKGRSFIAKTHAPRLKFCPKASLPPKIQEQSLQIY